MRDPRPCPVPAHGEAHLAGECPTRIPVALVATRPALPNRFALGALGPTTSDAWTYDVAGATRLAGGR